MVKRTSPTSETALRALEREYPIKNAADAAIYFTEGYFGYETVLAFLRKYGWPRHAGPIDLRAFYQFFLAWFEDMGLPTDYQRDRELRGHENSVLKNTHGEVMVFHMRKIRFQLMLDTWPTIQVSCSYDLQGMKMDSFVTTPNAMVEGDLERAMTTHIENIEAEWKEFAGQSWR